MQSAGVLSGGFEELGSDHVVSDYPGKFRQFEGQQFLCFVPLELYVPLAADPLLLEVETQHDLQLLVGCIEQSVGLNGDLRLGIVLRLAGGDLDVRDEVVPKGVWQFREILAIDADIEHIEGILVIEVRDIRNLACDNLIIIETLGAEPVRVVVQLVLRLLHHVGVLETHSDVVDVVQDRLLDGHVEPHGAAPEDGPAVGLDVLDLQLRSYIVWMIQQIRRGFSQGKYYFLSKLIYILQERGKVNFLLIFQKAGVLQQQVLVFQSYQRSTQTCSCSRLNLTDCCPVLTKPLPKKVISVLPLEGTKAGLKNRGERGQKRSTELSLAKIVVNLLFQVDYAIFTGPLYRNFYVRQDCTSLKPRLPPPQAQALPYSSIAQLLVKPQEISVNLGNGSFSLDSFTWTGLQTALTQLRWFQEDLIFSGKSFKPSCPLMLSPQENTSPSVVKQRVCPNPPATFAAFFTNPSISMLTFLGIGSFVFFSHPVCPQRASPQQQTCRSLSIAMEWQAPQAMERMGVFLSILRSFLESYLKK